MVFPTAAGSNLSGRHYTLPQDFEGKYNVAIIVYQRFQQSNVDTWGPLLAQLAQEYPEFRYYEVPTLPDFGWIQRSFIDGGMRGGIPDKAVRARTITLYVDVKMFNAALDLASIDDIYVLLVDRNGQVLWRASGDCTPQKGDALSSRLAGLISATGDTRKVDRGGSDSG